MKTVYPLQTKFAGGITISHRNHFSHRIYVHNYGARVQLYATPLPPLKMEGSGGHKSDYQNKLHVALKLHEFLRWTDLAVESN